MVGTRGSGTGEGSGPTEGKEIGGTRGERWHGGKVTRRRRRKKRCIVVVVVRMDAIRVGDRTQCPTWVRWLLSSLNSRESLTNARSLFLSLSCYLFLSSSPIAWNSFLRRSLRGNLRGGTCRGTASGTHRDRTVFPHKAHGFAARRDPIGSVKDTRRITQLG